MTRVLLVEDNPVNADMLGRRLTKRGYYMSYAANGIEAVSAAGRDVPDLILMDMSLPLLDGWEATRRIKAIPALAAIPIVALTAHAMSADRDRALAAGCDVFETKPVEINRLDRTMRELLARRTT